MGYRRNFNLPHAITFTSSLIIDISGEELLFIGFEEFLLLVPTIIICQIRSQYTIV